jgi:UDP-2,3-diacylglucosamine pyrophosphatase LpxH
MTNWKDPEVLRRLLKTGGDEERLREEFPADENGDPKIATLQRAWRRATSGKPEQKVKPDRIAKLVREALAKHGVEEDEVESISAIDIKNWQMGSKDAEGNPQVTDLEGTRVKLELKPKWADGPAWPAIQPARPIVIKATTKKTDTKKWFKTAVILPDPQIGYRRDLVTGLLDPFHDEKAMAVALQLIRELQPDVIVNLGDMLDFAEFGKFEQEPAFQMTVQATIDRAYQFLCEQKANAPSAHVVLIEGNHDRRIQKAIVNNLKSAFALTRAQVPDSWEEQLPVLSVPHLLRLDEIGVEYVSGYPAATYWLNDRLQCIHGHIVRSGGSTAKAVNDNERISTIFGHIHRIEMHHKSVNIRGGVRTNLAFSPGCLCRIDGAVPSTKGSTDYMGRPIVSYENWQQGIGVVTYVEGDGMFDIESVYIHEGVTIFRGKLYNFA